MPVAAAKHRPGNPEIARHRRPSSDAVRRAAVRAVRRHGNAFLSQREALAAIRELLRRDDPQLRLGARRLRRILLQSPGLYVRAEYAERTDRPYPSRCPVCGEPLRPIPNRTLEGGTVMAGLRCSACSYWTHRTVRIPRRYRIGRAGIDGREADPNSG